MIECQVECDKRHRIRFKRNNDDNIALGVFDLRILKDRYEIWSLGVHYEYRRKGYATQMLMEFLQQFKHDKPIVLYVYKSNEIAIRLYEKVGFVIVDECYFDSNAYKMQYVQSVH